MSQPIVVGVTPASVSRRAVDWAVARASERRQPIELLSIVGGAVGAVGEGAVIDAALAAATALVDAEAQRVAGAGVEVSTRVDHGDPVAKLLDASERAELLVIGSDYRGPGSGPAHGAHGTRIAAGAKCPVVVVPDVDIDGRSGVVVGVDGSETSLAAVRFAADEADRLGEPLIAVAAWTPIAAPGNLAVYPELYLANMQALTEETLAMSLGGVVQDHPDLEIVRRVERGYPAAHLNAHGEKARLLVVGTHGRGAIARFLLGSISHEVLARLATATAIVR